VIVGIDTGGTFTDFALLERARLTLLKIPSTPGDPARAIVAGLEALGVKTKGRGAARIIHGTTVATNALLTRRGGPVVFVTTQGFEDLLEIGRQAREHLYGWSAGAADPLVPRRLRLGLEERTYADGRRRAPSKRTLAALTARLRALRRQGAAAVAVGLLHAWKDGRNERAAGAAARRAGLPVTLSHALCGEHREYERFSTAAANAFLTPAAGPYLASLSRRVGSGIRVMKSSGLAAPARTLSREPVQTVLSGPAGGVVAAELLRRRLGAPAALSFDMGGTSTDVALLAGGIPFSAQGRAIAGVPLRVVSVAVESIGAGGGSLARRDSGGALRVGPESAGADPGPACLGRGAGVTVTDAHVALGRIGARDLAGGSVVLDPELALRAVARLARECALEPARTALGVLAVANAHMARALRRVAVSRGEDPAAALLIAFGGAGGLHAAELAAEIGARRAVIPAAPGAFSAFGMLAATEGVDRVRTMLAPAASLSAGDRERAFRALEREAARGLRASGIRRIRFERRADLRFQGQSHEVIVRAEHDPVPGFLARYGSLYDPPPPGAAIEIVALRVRAFGPPAAAEATLHRAARAGAGRGGGGRAVRPAGRSRVVFSGASGDPVVTTAPWYERSALPPGAGISGPARIVEYSGLTLVPPRWTARTDASGLLHLERRSA